MARRPKVGVFDSGVGGLSILAQIRRSLPACDLHYLSDNGAYPYGTKRDDEVVERAVAVVESLVRQTTLDVVVVACNTASTVALPALRKTATIPVVGVVPAIKPAAAITKTKAIGLLATPGTIARPYTAELIRQFASSCYVIRQGSSRLVDLAEAKLRGQPVDLHMVREEIAPFFKEKDDEKTGEPRVDTIVLGCTHFPLLLEELKQVGTRQIHWLDSGEAIAARVMSLLSDSKTHADLENSGASGASAEDWRNVQGNLEADVETDVEGGGEGNAWFTQLDESVTALREVLPAYGLTNIRHLPVS